VNSDRPIGEFLAEAEDILESANRTLMAIEGGQSGPGGNAEQVNGLFRALHSFKGLAGMFNLKSHADLAHKLEFLLDEVRLGRLGLGRETLDVLTDTLNLLGRLVHQLGTGEELESITPSLGLIDRLLAERSAGAGDRTLLNQIRIDEALLQVLTEYEEHRLKENIREGKNLFLVRVSFAFAEFENGIRTLTEALKALGEIICTLPTAGTGDGIGFTIMVGTTATREALAAAIPVPNAVLEPVPRLDSAKMTDARPETASLKTVSNTVRVDIHKLDSLMSCVGELHIIKGEIGRIASDLRSLQGFTGVAVSLSKAYKNLERRLNEIQEGILDVRMVPIGQIFTRLVQAVRKYAREAGKEVDLEVQGEETELDKLMVEDLADPLMHLIRNAIDHGIDLPEMRHRLGKPERGLVRLTAAPKGNHVVITIEDDGRGMDPHVLLAKAKEKGIVEPGADLDPIADRKEVLDLIFLPGFTTRELVTEISGRGVGMDVVKRNVARLSGMIDIQTETGVGTSFILTLPITLAIIKALLIEAGGLRFAVPLASVLEILRVRPEQIETIETREVMAIRDDTVPLLRLTDAFGIAAVGQPEQLFVVLVGLAERRLGIVVDGLKGQQEIVIKPLGKRLAETPGIAGATELGDKRVVLVLDVESLIERAFKRTMSRSQ
jgi:two-component system chemotaxis sensor kinase CheA